MQLFYDSFIQFHLVSAQCQNRYPYCPVQLLWCQFV